MLCFFWVQTLHNLEVLENNADQGPKGSLLDLLCHCTSPFGLLDGLLVGVFFWPTKHKRLRLKLPSIAGKRLFRKWLCHPLRVVADIEDRFAAVDDLEANAKLQTALQVRFACR